MRIINLSSESLNKDWSMQFMDEDHYDLLLDEDVAVYRADGSPLLVLLKQALDPQLASNAWSVLRDAKMSNTNNRSVASGVKSVKWKRRDGKMSGVSRVPRGWDVFSVPVGYFERNIRYPYAHLCAWNSHNPADFARMFPLLQQTTRIFAKQVPQRYDNQIGFCQRTHPDWVIPGTAYTTLTINKNFRTAAHKDAGDLESGFSNMFVIKQGSFVGANLVLPNWRIACKLDHLDFIMFDAHEFHGNTAMVKTSRDAVRCSVVCYYREKLVLCKSTEEELDIAKNRKPGDPLFPEIK